MRRAVAALLALAPAAASAHQAGLSYGTWTAGPDGLRLTLRLRADELAAAFPGVGPGAGAQARAALAGVRVSQEGAACEAAPGRARLAPPDGLELEARFRCPRAAAPAQVRLPLLARLPPGHVHLARVVVAGRTEERVADARRDGFEVAPAAPRARQAGAFLALGIEHILGGWDHLAFLLALLLAAPTLRDVLRSLTAFTAAHAATLALATLGVARPPPALVEPLIAASVVCVAAENLVELRRGRARRPRWPVALGFGLVHGFGFAGALDGLVLSGRELALALGAFNAGVELGQAAIALAAFPALALLRRSPRLASPALPGASAAVGAAGLCWLAARLPW